MLIHPTAAFFCVCVETGTSARVVHDGSDVAVWLAASQREREKVIGPYVIRATGQFL